MEQGLDWSTEVLEEGLKYCGEQENKLGLGKHSWSVRQC